MTNASYFGTLDAFTAEYSDALSDCLLSSTTEEDKHSMMKDVYRDGAHPAVAKLANVSISAREQAHREMAELLIGLLSNRCFSETRLALSNEGTAALQTSFSVLRPRHNVASAGKTRQK